MTLKHALLRCLRHAAPVMCMTVILLLSACAGIQPHKGPLPNLLRLRTQARQAYVDGDLQAAKTAYTRLIAAVPQEALYRFRLGNIEARLALPKAAVKAYRAALLRQPGLARAWHNLGIVRLRQAQAALIQSARLAARNSSLAAASTTLADALNALPVSVNRTGAKTQAAAAQDNHAAL